MLATTLALLLASGASLARAQSSVPDLSSIPSACATQCGSLIEDVLLCENQYPYLSSGNASMQLELAACVCTGLPSSSDLDTCSSCLSSNNDAPAGQAVSTLSSTCAQANKLCAFECNFPTCSSSDIPCQCSETYLQNILTCASCNSANNNAGSTMMSDYNALKDSCVNQNYTETPSATQGLPSPTGQANYQSPTLTGTGEAASATGDASGASTTDGVVLGGSSAATMATSARAGVTSAKAVSSAVSSAVSGALSSASAAVSSTGSTSGAIAQHAMTSASALVAVGAVLGAVALF